MMMEYMLDGQESDLPQQSLLAGQLFHAWTSELLVLRPQNYVEPLLIAGYTVPTPIHTSSHVIGNQCFSSPP